MTARKTLVLHKWPKVVLILELVGLQQSDWSLDARSFDFLTVGWYPLKWANGVTKSFEAFVSILGLSVTLQVIYGYNYNGAG